MGMRFGAGPLWTSSSGRVGANLGCLGASFRTGGCGAFIGLVAIMVAAAWPYVLFAWIARELGASHTIEVIVGWIPEGIWLAFLLLLLVGYLMVAFQQDEKK